jgi:3-deoxy-D-manno-octulosonic-acid transferase
MKIEPAIFKNNLLIFCYRILIYPLFLILFFLIGALGNKKIRVGIRLRWPREGFHPWKDLPKKTKPIWIHCSSGEFEYAKPLIRNLKKKHPQFKILVTYFSPSYKNAIENFPGVDFSAPLPWDFPGTVQDFLEHHQPQALLIARTDLWPELLHQVRKKEIPSLLFSATLKKPQPEWTLLYWSWIYNLIDSILAVDEIDAHNFITSGAEIVRAAGDTRYDQVFYRLLEQKKDLKSFCYSARLDPYKTLICGSTWYEDELKLIQAFGSFVNEDHLDLIIVPHEPTAEHIKKLASLIEREGLEFQIYSETETWQKSKILIVDKLGILAELYKLSYLAFVGGSFKRQVHSVMEPLACGSLVLLGPRNKNNREAQVFKKLYAYDSLAAVSESSDIMELRRIMLQILQLENRELQAIKRVIKTEVAQRQGATLSTMQWLENRLELLEELHPSP